jgi:hypothetical protein
MKRNFGSWVLLVLAVGCVPRITPALAASADDVTPIDPSTGKILVAPQDSAIAEDINSGPPNPQPPPYALLRFTENYSYLADPANRTDVFDPVKYIPLNPDDSRSYLSLGGEIRERFEHFDNESFGVAGPHEDDYLLQHIDLSGDLHVDQRMRVFVEGISGLQFWGASRPAVNQDSLNLQQAFADYTFGDPTADGDRLTLRGGRFEMVFGSGRLVAIRAAPNIQFKFDGAQFILSSETTTKLYGFATHPVAENRYTFDRTDFGQGFWGLYGTTLLGGPVNTSIDLYYLGFQNQNAQYVDAQGNENRHTIGSRLFGKARGWDYDIEPVVQVGSIANKDILAWTFASDNGYTLDQLPWTPRLGIKLDVASGDTKRGDTTVGTFNALYFKAGYFNDASLIRPANLYDVHPNLQVEPNKKTTLTFGSDAVWRYSNQDAIYGPPGNIVLPAGLGGSYVGTTAEAAIQYQLDRPAVLAASYVHMFTRRYVSMAGGDDVNYFGTWITYLW